MNLGFTIKKGWNINVDAKSIHFDAMIFHDPNKFIPSRFDVSNSLQSNISLPKEHNGIGGKVEHNDLIFIINYGLI